MKILIVEDDESSRIYLEQALAAQGFDIVSAKNGVEALDACGSDPPGLIVSDIMMPEMDGFELCRRVKEDKSLKAIPFVFYTSTYLNPEDEALGLSLGASCYLEKPMEPETFLSKINDVLDEYRSSTISIHEGLSKDPQEVDRMHIASVSRKLDKKVLQLEVERNSLRKEVQKNALILASAGEGIIGLDKSGHQIFVNPAAVIMLGYREDYLLGKNHHACWHYNRPDGSTYPESVCPICQTLKDGRIYSGEEYFIKKNGSYFPVRYTSQAIIEDGKITGSVISFADITERKRDQEKLKESEKKFRGIFDNMQEGYILSDMDGTILMVNPSTIRTLGYTDADELVGQTVIQKIYAVPEERAELIATIESRGKVSDYLLMFKHKDGSHIPVECSIRLVHEADGRAVAMEGIFRDITARRNLENRLRQAQKMEAIGTLAGGIAHDFNNILSVIIGFAELSLDAIQKGSPIEKNLLEVYKAGNRARDLIYQILTFARKSDEDLRPMHVSTIAREVLKFIRSTIPTTVEIKSRIEKDSPILGNPTQVHQILMNLCTNAAHAMEKGGGTLEVNLKDVTITHESNLIDLVLEAGTYVEIYVRDSGVGIPADILESIFEPYFTTKGTGEGTGMGLAVVHGIVESYHGKISVESEVGMGTEFRIYLPATEDQSPRFEYKVEELPHGSERILFVDDEPAIAQMGAQILEQQGYTVQSTSSSMEALELFRSKPNEYDLVVSDVAMPQLSGDQLAIKILAIRPEIPVVLCTGYSKRLSSESAVKIGVKALISKPIGKSNLANTVRRALDEANLPSAK